MAEDDEEDDYLPADDGDAYGYPNEGVGIIHVVPSEIASVGVTLWPVWIVRAERCEDVIREMAPELLPGPTHDERYWRMARC